MVGNFRRRLVRQICYFINKFYTYIYPPNGAVMDERERRFNYIRDVCAHCKENLLHFFSVEENTYDIATYQRSHLKTTCIYRYKYIVITIVYLYIYVYTQYMKFQNNKNMYKQGDAECGRSCE